MRASSILAILLLAIAFAGCVEQQTTTPYSVPPAEPPATPPANQPVTPSAEPTAPTESMSVSVDISNYAFSPAEVTIAKGGSVTWTNTDSVEHQLLFDTADGIESPELAAGNGAMGGVWGHTFNTAGEYPYHDGIWMGSGGQPVMIGKVIVT